MLFVIHAINKKLFPICIQLNAFINTLNKITQNDPLVLDVLEKTRFEMSILEQNIVSLISESASPQSSPSSTESSPSSTES